MKENPNDKYVITIYIDGTEAPEEKDEIKEVIDALKKLQDETGVVLVNVIEILPEPKDKELVDELKENIKPEEG